MNNKVIRLTENDLKNLIKESVKNILNEGINNDNYTHFAVNKKTNLIVNGWDYSGYDGSELRQYKKDYFMVDLIDYGFNPKEYKILTKNGCLKQGINPDDDKQWSNNGLTPCGSNSSETLMGESEDSFIGHGYKTINNYGGNEIQIADSGDAARIKFQDGEITDWLEISFDENGVAYVETPYGEERLDEYMRF